MTHDQPQRPSGGAWARSIADTYSNIARSAVDPRKAEANSAEASKYYGIADRLDRALPAVTEEEDRGESP